MTDDGTAVSGTVQVSTPPTVQVSAPPKVPVYLERYYWWAYVRPWAVQLFERPWLVNLILWGFYKRLMHEVFTSLGTSLPGKTLQISCCYGNLTPRLAEAVKAGGGTLDVVDVLPIQLENLRRKLPKGAPVRLIACDSTDLGGAEGPYDHVLLFFLLHEQPEKVRKATLAEALRVLKRSGTLVIVDFGKPVWWHPLRYLWFGLVLRFLEPFAKDLWTREISTWIPPEHANRSMIKTRIFGGMYQKIMFGPWHERSRG